MPEIIDCHANLGWDASNIRKNLIPTQQSYTALLEKMDNYDISKAIVLPFPSPGAQFNPNAFWYDLENQHLMQASRYSKRLIPFPGVNPNDEKSVRNINTLAISFNIKGVKLSHQMPMKFPIEQLIGHPLMKIIQEHNLIFMIHIGTGKEPGAQHYHTTLDYAVKVAKHYPDVKFIFCHLGRLHWSLIDALNLENVHLDTSALSMHANWKQFIALEPMPMFKSSMPIDVIEKLVNIGYEDKIIFGSDEPYTDYKSEIESIEKAEIPEIAKRKIFSENIKKLLGIGGGAKG